MTGVCFEILRTLYDCVQQWEAILILLKVEANCLTLQSSHNLYVTSSANRPYTSGFTSVSLLSNCSQMHFIDLDARPANDLWCAWTHRFIKQQLYDVMLETYLIFTRNAIDANSLISRYRTGLWHCWWTQRICFLLWSRRIARLFVVIFTVHIITAICRVWRHICQYFTIRCFITIKRVLRILRKKNLEATNLLLTNFSTQKICFRCSNFDVLSREIVFLQPVQQNSYTHDPLAQDTVCISVFKQSITVD